jgi:hypothetical protein
MVAAAAAERRSLSDWLVVAAERALADAESEARRQAGEPDS